MSTTPDMRKRTPEELAELRRITALQDEDRMATHSICERISPERKAAILKAALNRLKDPIELHYFISNWNSDGGVAPLLEIVQHPSCDAGTALWLYWDNDPYYYTRFRSVDDSDDDEERTMLTLSRTIEDRFKRSDFATSMIPFDPQHWLGKKSSGAVHQIPQIMTKAVAGN
ncbi:MAG: DUF4274 domain-containing protein [Gemmatales bacterium]